MGGVLALVIRTQLAQPNEHLVDAQTYNEFFTMHGSIMIYLFAVPFAFGLANYIVPLQVGAPDMAFPRLNALGLLALPVRRDHDDLGLPHRRRLGQLRLVRLRAALGRGVLARGRRRPLDRRRRRHEHRRRAHRGEHRDDDLHAARARA